MALRTPLKAIRAKCKDCTCNQNVEIRECPITDCPLYEYRMGHRPKKDGVDDGFDFFDDVDGDFTEEDMSDEEMPS